MSTTRRFNTGGVGLVLCSSLLGALTGCVGYVDGPRYAGGYPEPAPVYADSGVILQDDYVYYPRYEVYYSPIQRQYIYRDGRSWMTRSAPPRVSADVLLASPSVRLDFHDSPAAHHARVIRQYPKHWAPPDGHRNHGQGNRNDGRGNDREGHR